VAPRKAPSDDVLLAEAWEETRRPGRGVCLRGRWGDQTVWVDGAELERVGGGVNGLTPKPPVRFSWGPVAEGAGAHALAVALLLRLTGDVALAASNAPTLVRRVLARLPVGDFDRRVDLSAYLEERLYPRLGDEG
jgi:hypothetical protein